MWYNKNWILSKERKLLMQLFEAGIVLAVSRQNDNKLL